MHTTPHPKETHALNGIIFFTLNVTWLNVLPEHSKLPAVSSILIHTVVQTDMSLKTTDANTTASHA